MDGQRFDEVARLIGTGASRRRVLKGFAAGLLGLGGVSLSRRAAGALPASGGCIVTGSPCVSDDNECCGGGAGIVCAGVPRSCQQIATCVGETGPCNPGKGLNCCENLVCDVTDNGNGACIAAPPATCETDGDCDGESICCSDGQTSTCVERQCCGVGDEAHCDEDQVCNDAFTCEAVAPDNSCETDSDCTGGTICCSDGQTFTCVDEQCCGADDTTHCADDEVCGDNNICTEATPAECETDDDCNNIDGNDQPAAICCGGTCAPIQCCIADEDPNARCPDGTSCFEGVCDPICRADSDCADDTCCCQDGSCSGDCCPASEPTTLPGTGVGHDAGGSGLLTAGLLAAGAALVAGKKLRPRDETE